MEPSESLQRHFPRGSLGAAGKMEVANDHEVRTQD
jgi:hypothetical protein